MATGDPDRLATDAEREAFAAATYYARVHDISSPPEEAYLSLLPAARREIAHRFLTGLLRGDPDGLVDPVTVQVGGPIPEPITSVLGHSGGVECVRAVRSRVPETDRVTVCPLPENGSAVAVAVEATHGYGRARLTGDVYRCFADRRERLVHPRELIGPLVAEGAFSSDEQAARVRNELDESVANLALSRLVRSVLDDRVGDASSVLDRLSALPGADASAALERLATEGHPYHYGAKLRRGMSAVESLSYAPEFAPTIDVRFAAVRRECAMCSRSGERGLTERLFEAFDGLSGATERALPAGSGSEEYVVIPVHPWQYHHVLPERYAEQRADGRIVLVPYSHPATPLSNLRTVVPYPTDGGTALPHLKLAVDVQTTNVVRSVSPQAVANGPRVTRLLATIREREAFETLGPLDEPAAACYYEPGGVHTEGEAFDDARHLSGLLRENPVSHPLVGSERTPIAVSALSARSPTTGRPIVRDVIDRFAETEGITEGRRAASSFVERYLEVTIPDQLALLTTYGIALESHAQNSLLVVEEGRPVATLVRDFGGIRLLGERLSVHGLGLDPYPDSDLDADTEIDLYEKLYYALFQNQLATVFDAVSRSTSLSEAECWSLARSRCAETFEALAASSIPGERVERDRAALFADRATHKALTAMRLAGKCHEYVTSEVPNPLSAPGEPQF
ncbi:IucA/IucC family protein [Natronorarus salvus]|uniref:IucA/IucC family protein n=1 Tax=Natronorarus salvus TaxID=3117733 RepID=UPI002F2614A2